MKKVKFTMPEMSQVDLSINHLDIDAASSLNQNESHIHTLSSQN